MTPETCPNCGADVPRNAKACPECGSDERTGWSEDAAYDSLDLPGDDDFDYDKFIENEFGGGDPGRKKLGILWVVAAVALLVALMRLLV